MVIFFKNFGQKIKKKCFSLVFVQNFQYFKLGIRDKQSKYNLGLMYYHGIYVNQSFENAIHYFTLSANENYELSQKYLY